ncbi:alpha/beta hydrolase, partial [Cohnella lupini]
MNLKNKMVVASLVASLALLSLNISNPVHAAQKTEKGSSLVSVRDTLVNQYQIVSSRITLNKVNGYVQVDGLDVFKPKSTIKGRSYDTVDALKAVGEKESIRHPLTFVLVHGAWADSSYFNGVAEALRDMGYAVYTPEYAGHGANAAQNVTHEQITTSVVDYIKEKNLHDIVLLGHSFGGTVVEKAAEQIPDRIKRLVFFDAFVPQDGESVVDQFPAPIQELFKQLRSTSTDDTIALPFPIFRDTLA